MPLRRVVCRQAYPRTQQLDIGCPNFSFDVRRRISLLQKCCLTRTSKEDLLLNPGLDFSRWLFYITIQDRLRATCFNELFSRTLHF